MNIVGNTTPRIDGPDKVTGRAAYTGDLEVPRMLHAKLVESPLPHATIKRVDASRARALPGVIAVLTADELTDVEPLYGSDKKDRPIVATGKVRFQGEPVAAIAAVDEQTADAAVELVDVEYEELPVVMGIDGALEPAAAPIHQSNLCHEYGYAWGDVAQGFAGADRVFEDEFTFPMVYHYAMEPHTVIAHYEPQGIKVWSSAQHPFLVRAELARLFHMPLDRVQVVVPYVGGGFGSKSYTKIEPLVVALSREARRPVRLALSVEQAFKTVRRHSAKCTLRVGVKNDGTFVAKEIVATIDTGAYTDNGVRVCERIADRALGPYRFPHVKATSKAVYTNSTPAGSFRSIGGPQAAWACESQIDVIAHELGIDPLELRLKNLASRGEVIHRGMRPLEGDLAPSLRKVAEAIGWGTPSEPGPPGTKRGKGFALSVTNAGASPTSTSMIRMHADGSVTLMVGTTEIGQGSRTAMAQIAAQELSVPVERVTVIASDTSNVPYDRSTGSSRSTTLMGLAVHDAAIDVKEQLMALAAERFETFPDQVTLEDGAALHSGERVLCGELIRTKFGGSGGELLGRGYVTPDHPSGRLRENPVFWEVSIGGAEVEVEGSTGVVRILKYVSVADAGKAINPLQVEAQDEGAAMQGIGHTLFEEMLYDDGQLLNPNLIDYHVPTFRDLPPDFETIVVENGDGPGPYGAKGLGEGGIVTVAPAVGNALFDATGVRIRDLPLTPERVWRALEEAT